MHRLVARKLREHPDLLEDAKKTVDHWLNVSSPATFVYLRQWKAVLEKGLESTISLAIDESEHATAMRQSSPLLCLLSNKERFAFRRAWKESHGT